MTIPSVQFQNIFIAPKKALVPMTQPRFRALRLTAITLLSRSMGSPILAASSEWNRILCDVFVNEVLTHVTEKVFVIARLCT